MFHYTPHPHTTTRHQTGAPTTTAARTALHTNNRIGRLNARIGLKVTVAVGTMWCAYIFTALALISAPAALQSGDQLVIVAWIAQTFLQLVLLPIIIVGQNVQAKAADARAQATFDDVSAVLDQLQQMQAHLTAIEKGPTGVNRV